MAIIDYHAIRSGNYAQLTPSARILIPVLSTLCDNWSGALTPDDSKAKNLGNYAGLAPKAVRKGLAQLAEKGVISYEACSGRPPSIQYLPAVHLAKTSPRSIRPTSSVIKTDLLGHNDRPTPTSESSVNSPPDTPDQERQDPCSLNNCFKDLKTTTERTAANKVSESIIEHMASKHGSEIVVVVLGAMKNFNGEIGNPDGYFRKCVENGWIPTSKDSREREKSKKRREAEEISRQQREQELQRMEDEAAACPPEVATAAIAEINQFIEAANAN